jgi:hypothetical protein
MIQGSRERPVSMVDNLTKTYKTSHTATGLHGLLPGQLYFFWCENSRTGQLKIELSTRKRVVAEVCVSQGGNVTRSGSAGAEASS